MRGAVPAGVGGTRPWLREAEEDGAAARVTQACGASPGPLRPGGAAGRAGWAGGAVRGGTSGAGARRGAGAEPGEGAELDARKEGGWGRRDGLGVGASARLRVESSL